MTYLLNKYVPAFTLFRRIETKLRQNNKHDAILKNIESCISADTEIVNGLPRRLYSKVNDFGTWMKHSWIQTLTSNCTNEHKTAFTVNQLAISLPSHLTGIHTVSQYIIIT